MVSDQPMTVTDEDREAYARMEGYEPGDINWRLILECRPDCAGVVAFAAHRIAAAQAERDAVVKWLRDRDGFNDFYSELQGKWLSDRIEAGEHLTPPTA